MDAIAYIASFIEILRCLVQDGMADVHAKSDGGVTALHLAKATGHLDVVQYLARDVTADVEAKTNDGWSALTFGRGAVLGTRWQSRCRCDNG
jgi:ankyrin repeat protein